MVPPLSETAELRSDAPLAAWKTKGAFDRAAECRNAIRIGLENTGPSAVARQIHVAPARERDLLLKFVQLTRDGQPGRAQYVASLKREQPTAYEQILRFVIMKSNHDQYAAAQCVASDDARLTHGPGSRQTIDEVGALDATVIPFTPGRPIYDDATINNTARSRLVVDTGADRTIVAPHILRAAGLTPRRIGRIRGVTGQAVLVESVR
jgi:hypothetical protein